VKRSIIFVAVATGAIGAIKIARGPGYEYALVTGLFVPSVAAISAALERSKAQSSLFEGARRGLFVGGALATTALATAIAWGAIGGFCDFFGGVLSYALTAGAGTLLGGLWGAFAGEISRGKKAYFVVFAALAAPIGSALFDVWRFYATPAIFAFNPFVGYFSGTLYDTIIEPGVALLSYRAASAATIAGTLVFASAVAREKIFLRILLPQRALLGATLLAASFGSVAFGAQLGHWQTSKTIADKLGAHRSGTRCNVVLPDSVLENDADLMLKDCEEEVAAVEHTLGVRGPERITAFFFRDAKENTN